MLLAAEMGRPEGRGSSMSVLSFSLPLSLSLLAISLVLTLYFCLVVVLLYLFEPTLCFLEAFSTCAYVCSCVCCVSRLLRFRFCVSPCIDSIIT